MGTRELFARRSGKRETAVVQVGGEDVLLQALTFAERAAIQGAYRDADGKNLDETSPQKRQTLYVARSVVTPDGLAVFSESDADLALIAAMPAIDMDALNDGIMALNFAETEKNSTPPKNG